LDPTRLKSISLFKDIPDDALREIATFADEVSVEEGVELVQEGDYSYEFMAIEEGRAEVTRDGQHLADLNPGDFFGEMGLIDKDRRNATVVARSPMRLITLTGWDLKRMEKNMPQAFEKIRATIEQRRQA
jgi:CRP/FNR family transcriptional regulator, cyclic AMP receptor protein